MESKLVEFENLNIVNYFRMQSDSGNHQCSNRIGDSNIYSQLPSQLAYCKFESDFD